MIAEIYPIMRMPRHVQVFDYAIPESLHHLKRGDVVVIPFRETTVLGVIASVKAQAATKFRLKAITRHDTRIQFSDAELSFFESLAQELAQSVSSILYSSLPEFPKRLTVKPLPILPSAPLTIPSSESEALQDIAHNLEKSRKAFAYVSDIRRMTCVIAAYMRKHPKEKCIVLCPTVLDAHQMHTHLPFEAKWVLTGEENTGTQFSVWHTFRSQESGILVGTKNVLFAADQKTTTLFLVRSSHERHGHHEQNPRFDARRVANMLSDAFQTNLFFLDVMPRTEDTLLFSPEQLIGSQLLPPPTLIDMEQQFRASKIGYWISHETYEAIRERLEKYERVLLVLNKKFRAKRMRCEPCGKDVTCADCGTGLIVNDQEMRCVHCKTATPMTSICSTCHEPTIKESGFGNQKIEALLQAEFPHVQTCVLDKDHPEYNKHASLVIATSYYLENVADLFASDRFSLVVLLDADAPLYRSSYRASEVALYECEGWRALAQAKQAEFFVQTRSAPFFAEFFSHPEQTQQAELVIRKDYAHPPFCEVATLQFEEPSVKKAEVLQNQLVQKIRAVSARARIKKGVHPTRPEHTLHVRFSAEERGDFLALFRSLPDRVIIDTQANSG